MPQLSTENIRAGIFDGPQINQVVKDLAFINSINTARRKAILHLMEFSEMFWENEKPECMMNW